MLRIPRLLTLGVKRGGSLGMGKLQRRRRLVSSLLLQKAEDDTDLGRTRDLSALPGCSSRICGTPLTG